MAKNTLIPQREFPNLERVLTEYGQKAEAYYRDELISKKKNASFTLLDSSGLIERKVKEVTIGLIVKTERTDGTLCLCASDCSLKVQKSSRLRLAGFL